MYFGYDDSDDISGGGIVFRGVTTKASTRREVRTIFATAHTRMYLLISHLHTRRHGLSHTRAASTQLYTDKRCGELNLKVRKKIYSARKISGFTVPDGRTSDRGHPRSSRICNA